MGTRLTVHIAFDGGMPRRCSASYGYNLGKLYGYTDKCRASLDYLYGHCRDFREEVDSFGTDTMTYFECHGDTPMFHMNALYFAEWMKLYAADQDAAFGDHNDNADRLHDLLMKKENANFLVRFSFG